MSHWFGIGFRECSVSESLTLLNCFPIVCFLNFAFPILVIVCTFTRWIELYHALDATALSAAECLLKHFGRFGAPYQLRSDNGPHFIADLITFA